MISERRSIGVEITQVNYLYTENIIKTVFDASE